jgi:hypothetical protein
VKCIRVLGLLGGLLVQAYGLEREAFTFTHYNLEVRIEPDQQRLAVRGGITLRNDARSAQKNAVLQISSSLDWRSIQIEGKPVQFVSQLYASDLDHTGALSEAIVTLPREVPPQGWLQLEIGYEGVILLDGSRLTRIAAPPEVARHSDWDQIGKSFTAVRGVGYVAWYPVATESASLSEGNTVLETVARWKAREAQAQLKIKLTHAGAGTPSLLLCNGEPGGWPSSASGGRAYETVTECSFQTLGETVPLFVIGNYDGLDRPPLHISYLPGHKPAAENYALAAQAAAAFLAQWFGTAQGRGEARAEVIELSDPEAAPYESGSMLLTPLNRDTRLGQLTAVHQLTHAAFFSPRPWIYEGLAHFAQALYCEQENGRQAALDFMGLHGLAAAEAEKTLTEKRSQDGGASESLINTHVEEFYRSKAMYVWWMLRDMIGDVALKKALAAYRPEADVAPAYVQRLIAAQSKRDLEWFFDDWVYRDRGLPDFRVASVYPRPIVGGGYRVTVTIENLGAAGAEVPVTVRSDHGQATQRLQVGAKSQAAIRIAAESTPREVVVNDGSVAESDRRNNVYNFEAPAQRN